MEAPLPMADPGRPLKRHDPDFDGGDCQFPGTPVEATDEQMRTLRACLSCVTRQSYGPGGSLERATHECRRRLHIIHMPPPRWLTVERVTVRAPIRSDTGEAMDRMTELARMLADALDRGDLDTAGKVAAEQRAIIETEYSERMTKLTADPLPL